MTCGCLSAEEWKRSICDDVQPALTLLVEKYGMQVVRIEEDRKGGTIDLGLAGLLSEEAAVELETRFGANPDLSVWRHGVCCMRCRCCVADEHIVATARPVPGRSLLDLVWEGALVVFGLAGVIVGAWMVASNQWLKGIFLITFFGFLASLLILGWFKQPPKE